MRRLGHLLLGALALLIMPDASAGGSGGSGADPAQMQAEIPLKDIIQIGMRKDPSYADVSPELKTLYWFSYFATYSEFGGIHTFLFLESGDHAPSVLEALRTAGLDRRARLFELAMNLCGHPYPLDFGQRHVLFGWSRPGRQIGKSTFEPAPLNELDRAIMHLDREFGSPEDFWTDVVAYVERTPSLHQWAESVARNLTERERLDWLKWNIEPSYTVLGAPDLNSLPRPLRDIYLLSRLEHEVGNGGVHQFFSNSTGDIAPDVVEMLRRRGLDTHADLIQNGMDRIGEPYPADRAVRSARMYESGDVNELDRFLDDLTNEFDFEPIADVMLYIARQENVLPR